jgi:hypothetical protein
MALSFLIYALFFTPHFSGIKVGRKTGACCVRRHGTKLCHMSDLCKWRRFSLIRFPRRTLCTSHDVSYVTCTCVFRVLTRTLAQHFTRCTSRALRMPEYEFRVRRVHKVAKSDYSCPHGRTWLPLDGIWWNLTFEFFFLENLSRKF